MQEVIMQYWISLLRSCTLKMGFCVSEKNILHFSQCQMRLLVTLACLYNILSSLFGSLNLVSPRNRDQISDANQKETNLIYFPYYVQN